MNPTTHPSNNATLGPPRGWDYAAMPCGALSITRIDCEDGSSAMVSFWKPDAQELADLNRGASVMLSVYSAAHPPVAVAVSEPMLSLVEEAVDRVTGVRA